MKLFISRCLSVLLLCNAAQPLLAAPASKIQASYDVIGFGMTLANISETFTRTDDSYRIESVTKAVGLLARIKPETIRVISQGKITAQGLVPLSYSRHAKPIRIKMPVQNSTGKKPSLPITTIKACRICRSPTARRTD